jgi:hypothetical protein
MLPGINDLKFDSFNGDKPNKLSYKQSAQKENGHPLRDGRFQ